MGQEEVISLDRKRPLSVTLIPTNGAGGGYQFGQEKTSIRDLYSNQWDRRRLSCLDRKSVLSLTFIPTNGTGEGYHVWAGSLFFVGHTSNQQERRRLSVRTGEVLSPWPLVQRMGRKEVISDLYLRPQFQSMKVGSYQFWQATYFIYNSSSNKCERRMFSLSKFPTNYCSEGGGYQFRQAISYLRTILLTNGKGEGCQFRNGSLFFVDHTFNQQEKRKCIARKRKIGFLRLPGSQNNWMKTQAYRKPCL